MQITVKKKDDQEIVHDLNAIANEQTKANVMFSVEKVKITEILGEIFAVAGNAFRSSIENTLEQCPEAEIKPEPVETE